MKKLSLICMTVLAVFAMASCRGPRGPQGPAGNDGNANVVSSTVTVHSDDWEWVNNCQWMVEIDYPAINNNVYNYGAVLVYMSVGDTWSQVPLTYYYQDTFTNDQGQQEDDRQAVQEIEGTLEKSRIQGQGQEVVIGLQDQVHVGSGKTSGFLA